MTWLLDMVSNIKNAIILVLGLFGFGYIAVQRYKSAKTESKLKNIENKIAKTNIIVAKAKAREAETTTEIEVLRELNKKREVIQKEMEVIEKNIEAHIKEEKEKKGKQVQGRTRHNKVSFEI